MGREFTIETEREDDGRWLAEIPDLPGTMVYCPTREEAISRIRALALRVLADRLDHGEPVSAINTLFPVVARAGRDQFPLRGTVLRYVNPTEPLDVEGALMDRTFIDNYAQGPAVLRAAVQGLGRDELTAFPIPGTWSIQQIVVHILESDLIASHRMKRIVAEDNPLLIGYDETKAAGALFYHDEPLDEVLALFELNRNQTARILRKLPDEAFRRYGCHNERGRVTLGELVGDYVRHLDHHLAFVVKKRALLGKPIVV